MGKVPRGALFVNVLAHFCSFSYPSLKLMMFEKLFQEGVRSKRVETDVTDKPKHGMFIKFADRIITERPR